MNTHTNGPWKLYDYNYRNAHHIFRLEDNELTNIGSYTTSLPMDIAESNFALLAAAPDLLSALVDFVNGWNSDVDKSEMMNKYWAAMNAIEKATKIPTI